MSIRDVKPSDLCGANLQDSVWQNWETEHNAGILLRFLASNNSDSWDDFPVDHLASVCCPGQRFPWLRMARGYVSVDRGIAHIEDAFIAEIVRVTSRSTPRSPTPIEAGEKP